MIDRSYLPFKSAREHQDRGMEKWMGFFLSEHTTSLINDKNKVDMTPTLKQEEKFLLIGQLYSSQLSGTFVVKNNKAKQLYTGKVTELSPKEITIKTSGQYHLFKIDDILEICSLEKLDE
ncbi:hypothetical protein ACTQ4G_03955 [Streptococcus alactolyticus]|uniref:hypothetical protein n=1 Tax=Streptococcus alactolyticus TaxID=29389 RepID=UPI003F9707FC